MTQHSTFYVWFVRAIRITLILLLVYVVLLSSLVYFFDRAEQHKGFIEQQISRLYKRPVTIERIDTTWQGFHPRFSLQGIVVTDSSGVPVLSIESIAGQVDAHSILKFRPEFTELAVAKPQIKIETLDNGKLQIAGIELTSRQRNASLSDGIMSWLLEHQAAHIYSGTIVWHRLNNEVQRYQDISLVYVREQQQRILTLSASAPKGKLAFKIKTNGDMLAAREWGASFEILGDQDASLVAKDRVALNVENGQGKFTLATLDVQRIRDIVNLLGMSSQPGNWLTASNVKGRLHDVEFRFAGPLLQFTDWQLNANTSDIRFDPAVNAPGMKNLQGVMRASSRGGTFEFSTKNTEFIWPKWFNQSIPIELAKGQFNWRTSDQGRIDVALEQGEFKLPGMHVTQLNTRCEVALKYSRITTFADLFKVKSVADLSYQEGNIVDETSNRNAPPLFLDSNAAFSISSMRDLARYFPKNTHPQFRRWWRNAFVKGQVQNGKFTYQGQLSKTALDSGKAILHAEAEFDNLTLDFGFDQKWPRILNGGGTVTLDNDVLNIKPTQARLETNKITKPRVVLNDLFSRDRHLLIDGSLTAPLVEVTQFLFEGPLISDEALKNNPPISGVAGRVSTDISINIPLNKVSKTTVQGVAVVEQGQLRLPQGVAVGGINGPVRYTERSVETDKIEVDFLDGKAGVQLLTTAEAQPPNLKIVGDGVANVKALEPWAGQHLLSMVDGESHWQGEVLIEQNKVNIDIRSDLQGVAVLMPEPLSKKAEQLDEFRFTLQTGGALIQNRLSFQYADSLRGEFVGDVQGTNTLYDQAMVHYDTVKSKEGSLELRPGVNFYIHADDIDINAWLDQLAELAALKTTGKTDTQFLDSMRSVTLKANQPYLFGRTFNPLSLSALSVDGASWIGTIRGEQINGTLQAEPRSTPGLYRFNLANFTLPKLSGEALPPEPIEQNSQPADFPDLTIKVNTLNMLNKDIGRLELQGAPDGDVWRLNHFSLNKRNITTTATGVWQNQSEQGSMSEFKLQSSVREAGDVMGDLDMSGIIKKGEGDMSADIRWRGGPHEFDLSRLDGKFDLTLQKGELLKVEPGTGKLFGLLNVNAIARRLRFDFSDVFASGLKFDRMHYEGLLVSGDIIFRDAYIFSPAAYLRAEGRVGLVKEDVDLEVHVSPELGGNLTLLSALANPAAGAVLFITQKLFKNELRSASFKSYAATGSWDDLNVEELSSSSKLRNKSGDAQSTDRATVEPAVPESVLSPALDVKKSPTVEVPVSIEAPKPDSPTSNKTQP